MARCHIFLIFDVKTITILLQFAFESSTIGTDRLSGAGRLMVGRQTPQYTKSWEDFTMAVKVAINGFGRIGRLAFRQMFEADGYEVVAINDLTSPAMLAHLLKYDTAQGSFLGKIGENKHTVSAGEDYIEVDGKKITIYAIKDAKDCPWGELGIDVVLECTGFYTSKAKSM